METASYILLQQVTHADLTQEHYSTMAIPPTTFGTKANRTAQR